MISIKAHCVLDYCLGATFLVSPYLFGFSGLYFAHDVFTVLGITLIGYSLLSDYDFSIVRSLSLGMHMVFDLITGVFAILAPWVYGYHEMLTPLQTALHWILGLGIIATAVFTGRNQVPPASVLAPGPETVEEARQRRGRQAA